MSFLILLPDRNVKRFDWSGAFLPEAKAFAKRHACLPEEIVRVDISKRRAMMREAVCSAIESHEPRTVVFFCHGWRTGIQLGFDLKTVDELAEAIHNVNAGVGCDPVIILFACSTGKGSEIDVDKDKEAPGGDGGFADELRDALCRAGNIDNRVIAHSTAGHTTMNPFVRIFTGDFSPTGGHGGSWIVRPGSERWAKWRAKLKTPFRFDFPTMSVGQIHEALG